MLFLRHVIEQTSCRKSCSRRRGRSQRSRPTKPYKQVCHSPRKELARTPTYCVTSFVQISITHEIRFIAILRQASCLISCFRFFICVFTRVHPLCRFLAPSFQISQFYKVIYMLRRRVDHRKVQVTTFPRLLTSPFNLVFFAFTRNKAKQKKLSFAATLRVSNVPERT